MASSSRQARVVRALRILSGESQPDLESQIALLEGSVKSTSGFLSGLLEDLQQMKDQYHRLVTAPSSETLDEFLEHPYCLVPKGEREWYLIVPKFVDLQVGWLWQQTQSYNIFIINRYVDWLADIPKPIREQLGYTRPFDAVFHDQVLHVKDSYPPEDVWSKYKIHLTRREGDRAFRVKRGHEFDLIAALIKDGVLPFDPVPVYKEDIREAAVNFTLRDYQKDAVDKFLKLGAVGCFWPPSAGKTFLGLYLMSVIKGPKLIVVPTVTLLEQWEERIEEHTSLSPSEYKVITYQAASRALEQEWRLVIFDECQHLPATTYARLSTIPTRYRIGLSATPFREDGRVELIFALTGFPLGLDWHEIITKGVIKPPTIDLVTCASVEEKVRVVERILREGGRTLIFCDGLTLGQRLADRLHTIFISGASKSRLRLLRQSEVAVISRVGDEGLSLGTLKRVIEFDFLFGSRRQELQRLGRLFHSAYTGKHIILMTDLELEKYKKRLYSIYERGFKIEFHKAREYI
jgi:DNA excision repair protein ERCC-3